jgi:hypothetical protein
VAREVLLGHLEVAPLDVDGSHGPPVLQSYGELARRIVRDRAQRLNGVLERKVLEDLIVLDHPQRDRGGAGLEEVRHLAHVRVADDHVQAAVLLRVGVGLVARVHDRPFERCFEPDLGLEEVRPLRDLIRNVSTAGGTAEEAGAGEDLAGHEERHDVVRDLRERHGPVHEVVLVGAVGGALAVGVVLVDDHAAAAGHDLGGPRDRRLEDPFPRLVVDNELARAGAFGRRVLGMRVIDVVASAVGEDHVREAEVFFGRGGRLSHRLETARVAERRLLLVVPPNAAERLRGVGVDQER